jgi:phosphomethylpyrimidine synthase
MKNDPSNSTARSSFKTSLPNSNRIYITGTQPGIRVPFREIRQHSTRSFNGVIEENGPVRVYDASGPWGDPDFNGDVRDGVPPHRMEWIRARGDVEEYVGRIVQPIDNGYR